MIELNLTPEAVSALLIVAYLLGVGARIVWPYAVAYVTGPQDFDWGKAKGQIIAAGIGLAGIILSTLTGDGFVTNLGVIGFAGAFISGYGLTAIGRQAAKTADLRK